MQLLSARNGGGLEQAVIVGIFRAFVVNRTTGMTDRNGRSDSYQGASSCLSVVTRRWTHGCTPG